MSTVMATMQTLREQMMAAKTQMQAQSRAAFAEGSAEIFNAHPTLLAFSWSQYAPYFNDGDECVFRANTDADSMQFRFTTPFEPGENDYESEYDGYVVIYDGDDELTGYSLSGSMLRTWTSNYVDGKYVGGGTYTVVEGREADYAATQAVQEFMSVFDDDLLEEMFDNHVTITVNRDGTIETDEFYHD